MGMTAQGDDVSEDTTIALFDHCLFPHPPRKVSIPIQQDGKVADLRKKVAEQLSYNSEAFDLMMGKIALDEEKTLEELKSTKSGLIYITKRPNSKDSDFGIEDKKEVHPLSSLKNNQIVPYNPIAGGPVTSPAKESISVGLNQLDWNSKSSTGFVGLSNQGATCYMNSLIQTLYMTPEFRSALYKWNAKATFKKWEAAEREKLKDDGMDIDQKTKEQWEKDSIPRQLQLLFSRLQLRDQKAVKTKDLTNSFGWKDSDAFVQHDVQELFRVLSDALEKVLVGTEQENLINDLYQGEMKDYVKCKSCGHESSRSDKYLDIPLVIRGFGSTTPVKSIEEAIEKFVQPEVLEGDNQYHCEKCNGKVDALKGLKFSSFPYLLALQLKRFDFDYETFRRIKLNDKVTFPFLLDLNELVDAEGSPQSNGNGISLKKRKIEDAVEKLSVDADDMMEDEEEGAGNSMKEEITEEDKNRDEEAAELLQNGPNVYELYSVLVHRGSALGGHYYAYIKSFGDGQWYNFNDSQVSTVTEEDIEKTFGDDPDDRHRGGMYSYLQSSANAYMLMYRRVDPERNKNLDIDIPEELSKTIEEENEKHQRKIRERELDKQMIRFRVFSDGQPEVTIKIHQDTTLAEATMKCAEAVGLASKFPPDCIRLRGYQEHNELLQGPMDSPEDLNKTLDQLRFYHSRSVFVETKEPGTEFPQYDESKMMLRIIPFDSEENKFKDTKSVYIDRDAPLGELRTLLEEKFEIPIDKQRLFRECHTYQGPPAKELIGDDKTLKDHKVFEAAKIFLESCDDPESESKCFQEIERKKNLIELKYNLPGSEEFNRTISVSKKITFRELKELLEPIVGLPLDEFKVSRGNFQWKFELKNESESLDDCRLMDGTRLIIEKGKPMKEGEVKITFNLFDANRKLTKEYVEELFDLPIEEEMKLPELREILAKKLKEEKDWDVLPSRIRIREMFAKSPSTIFRDDISLKDNASCLYNGKVIGVQILDTDQESRMEDDVVPFVQQWFPSKYEFGPKVEMLLKEDMTTEDFRKLLSEKFGIENIGISKAYGSWPGPDVLEMDELDWDKETPQYVSSVKSGTLSTSPLYLRDGDIVFFRDKEEKLKELTPEEKKALEKAHQKKKNTPYHYAKEEALTIKV